MTESARLVIAVDSRQVSQGEADLARLGKTSSAVERELKALTAVASRLAAPLSAAFSAKAIYDSAEAYSTLTNCLRLVTDGAVALAAAQQAVFSISQNSRQPLEATAELYQRIASNQTALKLSGQGVADIVSTISKTLAISGASAEGSKAALIQLGQAFASGTLRGEELNSVLEQAPALSQAIAAGMGKTVGELRNLGASGKLTAEEVVKALQAQAGAVDVLFGKMTATVGGGLTTLGNSFTQYVGQIDQATGASGKLANEILSLSKAIDGSLPGALATLKDNASALTQVLEAGVYVAVGRVAGGLLQQAGAAGVAFVANRALLKSEADSAHQALLNAQAKQLESKSLVERAALEIKAAEGRIASDRAMQASQVASLKSVQASLAAELSLEQQRLKAQITDQGRAATVARMADVRLAEIAIIRQVEAAEKTLAATTIATSAQAQRAYTGRTAAVLAFGESTAAVNALAAASTKATAAASLTGLALTGLRNAGAGLLGLMGGPVGLLFMAGAAALSFVDWSDKSKTLMGDLGDLGKSVNTVRLEFNKLNEDQQRAQINTWKDKQLGATLAVDTAYKDLRESMKSALVDLPNPDMPDLAKLADQSRAYDDIVAKLNAAKASGQALGPVLREAAASGQISPAQLKSWENQAGVVQDAMGVVNQINERLDVQTQVLAQNTAGVVQNNAAKAGFTTAGEKYLSTLQKQLGKLQDNNDAVKEASRYITEHTDLSEADRAAILSTSYAIKAQADANAAGKKETRDAASEVKKHATAVENQVKALKEFEAQSGISTNSTNAMADAYLAGADNVRELTIQQKIEEELLKTGAGARDAVTAAVNREADAKNRLDIDQSIASMRAETTNTLAQATATLQGADALETFNIQKSMSIALSGKKIEYGSKEYAQLLEQTKAQLAANKALEQANSVEGIVDRLNPQVKLLRDYTKEQEALNAAIASGAGDTALYQDTLAKLALEYEQNKNAATAWGQFTEGAVDRVDSAFADAWKNIDDGFSGFATSLKDGFKQLLAELAHMAITKPIIMQIGASLGVGGLSAQSSGLFGGSSGDGSSLNTMFSAGKSIYSAATSGFGSAVSAGWSAGEGFLGGMQGAISNGASYINSGLSGLFGSGGVSAASSMAAGASQAGYTGAAMSSWTAGQNAAASATSYGPGLSAISGAIMGYQNSGFKGAAAGAAGGYAGAQAGATVGTYFGPIGTAVGAVIGGMLGAIGGSKLFGGDWQTKDQGFSLGVENGDFAGQQFEYQKKKGGLFGKNKKRTRLSALDPEMQSALDATYDATEGSVLDLFDRLNVQLNDGVLDGLNIAASKISTKDKTAEQIQEEIAKWFGGVADSMVSAVDAATGSGLGGYNFESLTTFVNNLYSVNDVLKNLNVGLFDLNVNGGYMAQSLSAMAGGLEALTTSASTYYDNFFTDTEKADDTLEAVRKQFEAINMTLPASRQGYRDIIEALDVTTEAGRAMFVTLTGLAGNAASAYSILEQRSDAAAAAVQAMSEKLIGVAGSAQSALQRAISAQQKATTDAYNARITSLNDMVSTATENVSGLTSVGNDLGAALKALRGDSDDAVKMLRAQAQATLQSALATARSGGSLSGFTGLSDALDTVSSNNTDLYGSMEDFARDQGRTANVVAELNGINGKQLTTAEKSLKGLEDQIKQAKDSYDLQMAQYDQQLEFAQAQMDALNGVDNSVMGVRDAINAMNLAVVAALAGITGKASDGTSTNNGTLIDSVYQSLLGRNADAAGKEYWQGQLANGAISYDQLAQAIANAAKEKGQAIKVPGYASGGDFGGGLRLVGENGPELEVTGPSRIFNANQTASMLRGSGGNSAELERKVDTLIDVVKQIVGPMKLNSDANTKLLKKFDRVGLPTTVVKEPA